MKKFDFYLNYLLFRMANLRSTTCGPQIMGGLMCDFCVSFFNKAKYLIMLSMFISLILMILVLVYIDKDSTFEALSVVGFIVSSIHFSINILAFVFLHIPLCIAHQVALILYVGPPDYPFRARNEFIEYTRSTSLGYVNVSDNELLGILLQNENSITMMVWFCRLKFDNDISFVFVHIGLF